MCASRNEIKTVDLVSAVSTVLVRMRYKLPNSNCVMSVILHELNVFTFAFKSIAQYKDEQ